MGVAEYVLQLQQQPAASLLTAFIATGVLLLLMPKLRNFVLDALETVIATFLLIVLIVAVLGLPFAATYIAFKGVAFTFKSLFSNIPSMDLLSVTAQQLTQHT